MVGCCFPSNRAFMEQPQGHNQCLNHTLRVWLNLEVLARCRCASRRSASERFIELFYNPHPFVSWRVWSSSVTQLRDQYKRWSQADLDKAGKTDLALTRVISLSEHIHVRICCRRAKELHAACRQVFLEQALALYSDARTRVQV